MDRLIRRTPSRRHLALLARMEARQACPEVLAPDFLHGSFALEQTYAHLDAPDTVAFIAMDEQGAAVGLFEDYFLSLHTCAQSDDPEAFLGRLLSQHAHIESIILLDLRAVSEHSPRLSLPVSLHAHLSRAEFSTLEQRLYHIEREQSAIEDPHTRHKNDVLSLIAIASRAHHTLESQAA